LETADYYRQKAAQGRRLADALVNQNDPVVAALLVLAVEFEAKSVALAAVAAATNQIDRLSTDEAPEGGTIIAGSA
jgi:hypothetical protein